MPSRAKDEQSYKVYLYLKICICNGCKKKLPANNDDILGHPSLSQKCVIKMSVPVFFSLLTNFIPRFLSLTFSTLVLNSPKYPTKYLSKTSSSNRLLATCGRLRCQKSGILITSTMLMSLYPLSIDVFKYPW
jgi:hypothetical protein